MKKSAGTSFGRIKHAKQGAIALYPSFLILVFWPTCFYLLKNTLFWSLSVIKNVLTCFVLEVLIFVSSSLNRPTTIRSYQYYNLLPTTCNNQRSTWLVKKSFSKYRKQENLPTVLEVKVWEILESILFIRHVHSVETKNRQHNFS